MESTIKGHFKIMVSSAQLHCSILCDIAKVRYKVTSWTFDSLEWIKQRQYKPVKTDLFLERYYSDATKSSRHLWYFSRKVFPPRQGSASYGKVGHIRYICRVSFTARPSRWAVWYSPKRVLNGPGMFNHQLTSVISDLSAIANAFSLDFTIQVNVHIVRFLG